MSSFMSSAPLTPLPDERLEQGKDNSQTSLDSHSFLQILLTLKSGLPRLWQICRQRKTRTKK
jgi:hypothetical protein